MAESSAGGSWKIRRHIYRSFRWRDYICLTAEYAGYIAESILILAVIAWFFYRSAAALAVLSPLAVPLIKRSRLRHQEKKADVLRMQFKELMSCILTSMRAGESAENAFRGAYPEMLFLYGKNSMICSRLERIGSGMDNHVPLEDLLLNFAEESQVEEIREFSEVFAIAKRSGGNMAEILSRTISMIQSRADVENEIRIMVSARRMEQHIMDVVPFGIIVYIELTSEGYFDSLYHNAAGIAVMSVALTLYLAALALSEKILKIRV